MADAVPAAEASQPSTDAVSPALLLSPTSSDTPPPDSPPARHIPSGFVVCDECDELVLKPLLAAHQSATCAQSLAECALSRDQHDICHLHSATANADDDAEDGEEAEQTRAQIAAHIEQSAGAHVLYLMDVVGALQQQVAALSAELTVERRRRLEMEEQIKGVITTLAAKVDYAEVARFSAPSAAHSQPRAVVKTSSGRVVQRRTDRDRDDDNYSIRSSLQYEAPPAFDPVLDRPLAPSASAWKSAVVSKPDASSSNFLASRAAASSAPSSSVPPPDAPLEPAQLAKRIHSVLNKLTATNYDKLSAQLLQLFQSIAQAEQLAQLTAQLFDKALDDIFFGALLARLCRLLAAEVTGPAGGSVKASFRYFLLNKCQDEFVTFVEKDAKHKKDVVDEQKAPPAEEVKEELSEGKAEAVAPASAEEREAARAASKRRFIAAIRFIGELFLQDLVTLPIMLACIAQLLASVRDEAGEASEDSIQGLCKLLSTVGGKVEEKEEARERMRPVWAAMRAEAEAEGKHSSRGRFALLDVLDTRAKGWKVRESQKGQSATDAKIAAPAAVATQPVMRLGFDESARGAGGGGGGGGERERAARERSERERELIPQNTSDARLAQASAMATSVKKWTPGAKRVTATHSTEQPT